MSMDKYILQIRKEKEKNNLVIFKHFVLPVLKLEYQNVLHIRIISNDIIS